jgi:hypothetical protein
MLLAVSDFRCLITRRIAGRCHLRNHICQSTIQLSEDAMISSLLEFVWARLGHCPYCMRKAFQSASVAWAIWFVAVMGGMPSTLLFCITFMAAALTTLWLTHLVAYAIKSSSARRPDPASDGSRRAFLWDVARAGTFALAGTVLPVSFAHAARHKHHPLNCSSVGLNCPCCCWSAAAGWQCSDCNMPCDQGAKKMGPFRVRHS